MMRSAFGKKKDHRNRQPTSSASESTSLSRPGSISREQGKVKWFDENKGCGIIGRRKGADVSVHFSAILGEGFRTLEPGQTVIFEITENGKRYCAVNVQPMEVRRDAPE